MRWNNLSLDQSDRAGMLPFSLPGAVERTFDTPGFAGMTFYEIQAKSIISRVPGASRMPFEWTINPYRGCTHACRYCQTGDTPILMADGRTRPLGELVVGDRVYGTVRDGRYRRYVPTTVLAHWSTVKPAYRVTLADGTELTASGDHRYLTERGWKYVRGAAAGRDRRPYLTTGNKLMGTGRFAEPPKDCAEYRTGYLRGIALARRRLEPECLERAQEYLGHGGVGPGGTAPAIDLDWPANPSANWSQGFLAGAFDVVGSQSTCIRITDPDPAVLARVSAALDQLGFGSTTEATAVRLLGGMVERLRFCHTVDPAVTRKRLIAGAALKSDASLGVVAITPLGLDLPMFDITTGTGDFIANGVVSHNCFARHTHEYLDLDAGHDFDTKVVVKVNAPRLLRKELNSPQWTGAHIAMGTNVDCYQRAEGRYGLMRGIISELRDHANPFSILTKGTLIARDLDLLRQAAEVTDVGISLSIGFVDETVWRTVEPGTPSPRRRLDTVRRFADAGFAVHVLMAPILPGLTDTDESIDATVAAIAAAGAVGVSPIVLHLRPGSREWYAAWLAGTHPELVERYRTLYPGSYAPKAYQREVSARVAIAARRHGIGRPPVPRHRGVRPEPAVVDRPTAQQLTLL